MLNSNPVRIGIIGMGGYAGVHHAAVRSMESTKTARLVCTCDPTPDRFIAQAAQWDLSKRGVKIHADYLHMLDAHAGILDLLTVPTPIPFHAEMHREGVNRGLAVYLEKPPTLDPAELERMIETDREARVPTLVGFNFIGEGPRRALKSRLLAGEFGALREARLFGLWPRSNQYYNRNAWAGRLVGDDGRLILDSCVGNALSHHVHNILHWAGIGGLDQWAVPMTVQSLLFRAHSIQGADTFFLSTETDTGVPIRIALSHACHGPHLHRETLICDKATIHYMTNDHAEVLWRDGRSEMMALPSTNLQVNNYRALFACLRGESSRPPTTLIDTRPFVHLHALSYVAAQCIKTLPSDLATAVIRPESNEVFYEVRDIFAHCERFLSEGVWPWQEAEPAVGQDRLGELDAVVRRMTEPTEARVQASQALVP